MEDAITTELREILQDRDRFMELVTAFIDRAIEDDEPTDDEKFNEFYRLSLETLAEENISNVFRASASPIETIFLNSLLLGFIKADSLGLVVHPVNADAEKEIEEFRKYFAKFKEFLEWYMGRFSSHAGIESYLDRQVEERKMGSGEREYINRLMVRYRYLPLEESFHLTLQPRFSRIVVDDKSIRPDMLFWIPARPDIKIIVECDGFDYHSDKARFTNDRRRDRALQDRGYQVLRFSGSEIYRNPAGITRELAEFLWGQKERESFH